MAEIKSTLELALERTKHLTLSDEEKQKQRTEEFSQKIKGIVQKYHDKQIKHDRAVAALITLKEEYALDYKELVIAEALDKIRLDRDNTLIFKLLEGVCELPTTNLRALCDDYLNKISAVAQQKLSIAKHSLEKEHGISGTAVVPNIEADEALKSEIEKLYNSFNKDLRSQADELSQGC